MKEAEKNILGLGFSIFMLIVVVLIGVYTVYKFDEKFDEKMDMKKSEKIKEESMRDKLVSEKLNEPKDSFYIEAF